MARILCVEDEPELSVLLPLVLERAGHECLTAMGSEEGLSILRSQPIDLVAQDYTRIGGFEFLYLMKSDEALREIPVLILTPRFDERHAAMMEEFGLDFDRDLDGFLTGPFKAEELVEMVADILERRSGASPPE